MATRLSLYDRVIFALIGAVFGVVMGSALLFGVMFAFALPRAPIEVIWFSGVYFGFIGFVMGSSVGSFVGAAFGGLLDLFAMETSVNSQFTDERTFRPIWIGVMFILWLLGSWLTYLRW